MRSCRAPVILALCLVVGLSLVGPSAAEEVDPSSAPSDRASHTGQSNRAQRATQALATVESMIDGRAEQGADAEIDYSMALYELRRHLHALPKAERQRAEQILARPGDDDDEFIPVDLPGVTCSATICVHWTERGQHAAAGSDGDLQTIPRYIQQVLSTTQALNGDYVAAGYRRPKPDGIHGGGDGGDDSDKVDVYIGNLLSDGIPIYGYCTSDDPNNPNVSGDWSVWSYCAIENDFAGFPRTRLENLQVTAAHEYFHAIQFGYDGWEDPWILESTATWVEDELFDAVNDNRQYLRDGPMRFSGTPLDFFGGSFPYGAWIWWRFLTEKFETRSGKLPTLVRDVWDRLDGRPGAPDDYSLQALTRVLGSRGTSLRKEFQLFTAANRHPRTAYDEGGSYPVSPTDLNLGFSRAQRKGAVYSPAHLTSGTVRLRPKDLSQRDWRVRVTFNAPQPARGGAFVVVVHKRSGRVITNVVRLSRTGGGSKTLPFSSRSIKGVDVIFVNTSARFDCSPKRPDGELTTRFSCEGVPRDDNLRSEFTARTFRA